MWLETEVDAEAMVDCEPLGFPTGVAWVSADALWVAAKVVPCALGLATCCCLLELATGVATGEAVDEGTAATVDDGSGEAAQTESRRLMVTSAPLHEVQC